MRRTDRGFTLPEMLVALALSGIILLLGTALLIEFLHHAERHAGRTPSVGEPSEIACDALEHDLRAAARLEGGDGAPQVVALLLPDGRKVAWEKRAQSLWRVETRRAEGEEVLVRERRFIEHLVGATVIVDPGLTLGGGDRSRGMSFAIPDRLARFVVQAEGSQLHDRTVFLRNAGVAIVPTGEEH